jgi:deoxyadenosine/deoxycytidine kinase
MKEDDRMRAYQLTERLQFKIEFYLNHSNESLHTVASKALISTNLEVVIIERQLEECKKRLEEHGLPTETDVTSKESFIPDLQDYLDAVQKSLDIVRDMEFMEKFPRH